MKKPNHEIRRSYTHGAGCGTGSNHHSHAGACPLVASGDYWSAIIRLSFLDMLRIFEQGLRIAFWLHDFASDWLARHLVFTKRSILIVAHLSLFGFLFPDARREFGDMGGNILVGLLYLSPFAKITRMRFLQQLMGLRREIGILFGYLVTVHGLGFALDPAFAPYLQQSIEGPLWSFQNPIFFGLAAYALTLPLLFTSNTLANRLLGGKNWKLLHRTVYIMALLAVIHRFTIRGMDPWSVFQAVFFVVTYILAKLLAWRNFLPPLRSLIDWVAQSYAAYRSANTVTPPTPPVTPPPATVSA